MKGNNTELIILSSIFLLLIGLGIYISSLENITIETECYDKYNSKIKGQICEKEIKEDISETSFMIFELIYPLMFFFNILLLIINIILKMKNYNRND